MKAVRKTAKSWRELHQNSHIGHINDEEKALLQEAAQRLREEMLRATTGGVLTAPSALATAYAAPPLCPTSAREGFDQYFKSKKKIVHSTKDAYTESFKLFAKLVGGEHRLTHDIRCVEIKDFNDELAFIPLYAKKRGIQLRMTQAILKNPPKLMDRKGTLSSPSASTAPICVSQKSRVFRLYD